VHVLFAKAHTQIVKVATAPGKKYDVSIRYSARGPRHPLGSNTSSSTASSSRRWTTWARRSVVQGVPYSGIYPALGSGEQFVAASSTCSSLGTARIA
jgi:hypothetical protein